MNIYLKDNQLATENLVVGTSVYGELLIKSDDKEYRIWNPTRSKLAASLLNGMEKLDISDIIKDGLIYAVEFSPVTAKKLVRLANQRTNIAPILGDATKPKEYLNIVEKVDLVYCDVAQPTQTELFVKNMNIFTKEDGKGLLMLKARSIDVVQKPKKIFKEEEKKLKEKGFTVLEKIKLEPYEKDHIAFLVEKNFSTYFTTK